MDWALSPHTSTPSTNRLSVNARIGKKTGPNIEFIFNLVSTSLSTVRIPAATADPQRRDNLWHHTCFELFIRPTTAQIYFEFNFSPSGDWAAYRFRRYRDDMKPLEIAPPPHVMASQDQRELAVTARLNFSEIPALIDAASLDIGLSLIAENMDGTKSYWALAHPSGTPDFHHPDCFAARIDAMNDR